MAFSNVFSDGVSVKVGADTGSFQKKMQSATSRLDELGDEATQTAGSLGVFSAGADSAESSADGLTTSVTLLGNQTDEAEDEISAAGRSAMTSAPAMTSLSVSTNGLSVAMSGLATSMVPVLVSLGTLSTILAPLAAAAGVLAVGVGSLAAAFGGLALVGVVTHMSQLQEAFKQAKTEIRQIIQPLGQVFGPLLVQAVRALPQLVQKMVDAVGSTQKFRKTLMRLGEIAMQVIPALTRFVFNSSFAANSTANQDETHSSTLSKRPSEINNVLHMNVVPIRQLRR